MIAQYLTEISLLLIPVLVAVTIHETAHGYAAYFSGDMTPKYAGRLSLNPLKHLDPVGSIVFLITRMIGWAKPVPINPNNFKNLKRDTVIVSLAGPLSNMALAVIFAFLLKGLTLFPIGSTFIYYKIMVPIAIICKLAVQINIAFALFNLIPIPPLDGSKVLYEILPYNLAFQYQKLEPYGFIIILVLLIANVFDYTLWPIVRFFTGVLL